MTTRVVKSWRIEAERMPLQVRIEIASETHGGRDTELVFNSIDSAASFLSTGEFLTDAGAASFLAWVRRASRVSGRVNTAASPSPSETTR